MFSSILIIYWSCIINLLTQTLFSPLWEDFKNRLLRSESPKSFNSQESHSHTYTQRQRDNQTESQTHRSHTKGLCKVQWICVFRTKLLDNWNKDAPHNTESPWVLDALWINYSTDLFCFVYQVKKKQDCVLTSLHPCVSCSLLNIICNESESHWCHGEEEWFFWCEHAGARTVTDAESERAISMWMKL